MVQKKERLEKLLSRLGYGSRKDVPYWIREGWITVAGEMAQSASQKVVAGDVLLEGQPLDYADGLTVVYNKPIGTVCSRKEDGRLIYADFPERWLSRKPALSSVGRLDKDTSGLLIITDDGQLNHNLTSPKHGISKTYDVILDKPLAGNEVALFASGSLMLEADDTPCKAAELSILDEHHVTLVLHEGRYHQVRRMFAAVGNHVSSLSRTHIGDLSLAALQLEPGQYQCMEDEIGRAH
ncbi:MAG: pseudouridine synthase, partial [Mariprofundaceae bacterium]|nr:pseudouridine synthase [Mariprofundaceae bacterium]